MLNLVTVKEMLSYLRIPEDAADETLKASILSAIEDASSTIEQITGRKLSFQTHRQTFDGRRSNRLLVREYPLKSVISLTIDKVEYKGSLFIEDEQTVVFDTMFPLGVQNIVLVYTAGYEAIPGILKRACRILAGWFLKIEETGLIGRTGASKNGESVSTPNHIPKVVYELLHPFIRQEFPLGDRSIGSI